MHNDLSFNEMESRIRSAVFSMLEQAIGEKNLDEELSRLYDSHIGKTHFVPTEYRIIGGLFQSLNIKYGNFIEELIREIVRIDGSVEEHKLSGKKEPLRITQGSNDLIGRYMRSHKNTQCTEEDFDRLMLEIVEKENQSRQNPEIINRGRSDIDVLFKTDKGICIYVEVKFNDDHDTGKFENINKKLISTYALLVNSLNIRNHEEMVPILYYFNSRKRWKNNYLPGANVLRGAELFERYFSMDFDRIKNTLESLSRDEAVKKYFRRISTNAHELCKEKERFRI